MALNNLVNGRPLSKRNFRGLVKETAAFPVHGPIVNGIGVFNNFPIQVYASATPEIDWTLCHHQWIELNANTTVELPTPLGSYTMTLFVYQDETGGWTLDWPVGTKFPSGQAPVIPVNPTNSTLVEVYTDGTTWFVRSLGDFTDQPILVSLAVTIAGGDPTVQVPDTAQFTATGTYSDASTADITADVTWTSSSAHMTVDIAGLGTAVSAGDAIITAALGPISNHLDVTITPAA
jgi:hypothetical protein